MFKDLSMEERLVNELDLVLGVGGGRESAWGGREGAGTVVVVDLVLDTVFLTTDLVFSSVTTRVLVRVTLVPARVSVLLVSLN